MKRDEADSLRHIFLPMRVVSLVSVQTVLENSIGQSEQTFDDVTRANIYEKRVNELLKLTIPR